MKERKNFWDKNAGRYDRFMRKDRAAYEEMYALIQPIVRHKTVLELATGTGLIAKNIVNAAAHIEATDASAEMIAEAKRDNHSAKLHFSVQDMFRLPYAESCPPDRGTAPHRGVWRMSRAACPARRRDTATAPATICRSSARLPAGAVPGAADRRPRRRPVRKRCFAACPRRWFAVDS